MPITYGHNITPEEINELRKSLGWRRIHPQQLLDNLAGSSLVVTAICDDRVIGMSRLLWTGGVMAVIPDLLIKPEFQNQGIEEELITRILDFLRTKLKPGYGIQVDLRVWQHQDKFEALGFIEATQRLRGTPLHICLTDQIELTDAILG